MIRLRLLGEILGAAERTADATERTADAAEQLTGELARLRADVRELLVSGAERPLIQNVEIVVAQGWFQAFQGYEVLVETLRQQGFDVTVDPAGDAIEIAGTSEQKALPPAGHTALQDLRRAVLDHQPTDADLDDLERRYRRNLIRWFGNLEFQGLMRAPKQALI